ncbi:MAG: EamA family transporter RarD [Clostridia bacterium]|nr:EamA family transporter RarD [Clostridia bacterium]
MRIDISDRASGVLCGASAFGMWGLLPLYWKLLNKVPAYEILAHRVFWSFIFVGMILVIGSKAAKVKEAIKDRKSMLFITICSLMIGINWFLYIWAVNSNHIVESSMGYYINPLMSILFGMTVLKEKFGFWQYTALISAAGGVVYITVQFGSLPWIALALSVSFALYGLFKKMVRLESAVGLFLETSILAPAAVVFLITKQTEGSAAFLNSSLTVNILLACSGLVTATPLLLFAKGAKKVELSTIGFLQYISPSISLILGIAIFKEHFSKTHIVGFGFIWTGILVFSLSQLNFFKKRFSTVNKLKEVESE